MTVPFELTGRFDKDGHAYRVYESTSSSDGDWLGHLAAEYVKILTHRETPLERLHMNHDEMQMDLSHIQKYLRQASIPKYKRGNFNVVRSDFGELLCYLLLERDFHTLFGAKSITTRELRDLPGRGIDAIGVEIDRENNQLILVLCEVKVSDEQLSPPRVVDSSDDCLSKQHRYHLQNLNDATKDKIWRVANRTQDPVVADLLTVVALYLEEHNLDRLRIVLCNVLIRPKTKFTPADFGSFFHQPEQYNPATIRFLVACIPDDVDAIITQWYDVIQNTEASIE